MTLLKKNIRLTALVEKFCPEKNALNEKISLTAAFCSHNARRARSHHRCIDYMIYNAIPSSPGKYRIFHNATCSYPEQLHPSKTNTNILRGILNNYNSQADLLTTLVHSHREVHTFLPIRHLKDLYILQYFESYKSKMLPHPIH